MSKIWTWFSLFFILNIFIWIQSPRLPYPKIISEEISIEEVFSLINFSTLLDALLVSLAIAVITILITMVFSLPLAIYISSHKSRSTEILSKLLYLPILSPLILPSLGLYDLFSKFDITGSIMSISLAQSSLLYPYMLKPLEDFLVNKGQKYQKISKSLGANSIETFLKITLPNLKPGICLGSFFVFVGSINDYIISFLLGDFKIISLSVLLYPLMQSDNRMTSSLIIILYSLPLILLVFFIHSISKKVKNA